MKVTRTPLCSKCHGKDIRKRWHANSDECGYESRRRGVYSGAEHLHHFCQTCLYEWIGLTADGTETAS